MDVLDAIRERHSARAFLDRPVPRRVIEEVLDVARWSPSGGNVQPWQVAVVTGDTKRRMGEAIIGAREDGIRENPDFPYYPESWVSPYKDRRFQCGIGLYQALGIDRKDASARKAAWYANYRFFDAPVGLLFFLDRALEFGFLMDMGIFMQSVMLAAKGLGLATCAQASLAEYPDLVRGILDLPRDLEVVGGMSLGYPDPDAPINQYRTARIQVDSFTRWYE